MNWKDSTKNLLWPIYVRPKGAIGNRVQGAVLGSAERHRVTREWNAADRILLVHTPGKVGSKAILATLQQGRRKGDAVFHTHRINPDNSLGVTQERATLAPRRGWYTADFLGDRLRRPHDKQVAVMAAMRDPIERALSSFLQNLDRYGESGQSISTHTRLDPDDLIRQFIERFPHAAVSRWVEWELNAMFGVDFYNTPFDHSLGYQIQTRGTTKVGVIRHDKFAEVLTEYVQAVTGLEVLLPERVNDSSAKAYGTVYKTMCATMRLPIGLLEESYGSAYVRHFFSDAERELAICRWSGEGTR